MPSASLLSRLVMRPFEIVAHTGEAYTSRGRL